MRVKTASRVASGLGAVMVLGAVVAGCGSGGAEGAASDVDAPAGAAASASAAPDTGSAAPSSTPADQPGAPTAVQPTTAPAAAPDAGAADQSRALLTAVRAGGDPVVCEFSKDGASGAMTIRGEDSFRFDGASEKGPVQMVRDGDNLYLWQPGATQGLSMNVSAQPGDEAAISPSGLEDEADAESLRCQRYTGGDDVFAVPGGVDFISLDGLPGTGGN